MTRWIILAGLVVVNGLLGTAVYQRLAERHAQAQIGGGKIDVISVAGVSNGQTVVYMMEANSGRLQATRVDVSNGRMDIVARADVGADMKQIP